VIVVVMGGLSLFEMGEVLSAREADGGFDCERALNLDGGPSTAVSFSMDGKSVEVKGRWKISDGLAVKSR
jgi:Phosphodiester glycosidase